MEQYSPELCRWVAKQLQQADAKLFAQLADYYEKRGGPGLELVKAERLARQTEISTLALSSSK
jgi:hypothetical protein